MGRRIGGLTKRFERFVYHTCVVQKKKKKKVNRVHSAPQFNSLRDSCDKAESRETEPRRKKKKVQFTEKASVFQAPGPGFQAT